MTKRFNELGQPIGDAVPNWTGAKPVPHAAMDGRTCAVVPLSLGHEAALFAALSEDQTGALWTYMPVGPFPDVESYAAWVKDACTSQDPLFFAIVDKTTGLAVGVASYLRIQPENGVIEVGYITFSPALQKSIMATEAMFLMMKHVFDDLGYRRYEWKCDALNAPSRRAAERLGFEYNGMFKQALVYKGRNRDTAWFSILDCDWPNLKNGYLAWLDPANFNAEGRQRQSLQACISSAN